MKMYVGITDYEWYIILKQARCEEVSFWRPKSNINFRALNTGEMLLFKLHSPKDYIVGGGFFLSFSILPTSLAWEAFGIANGANNLEELNKRVYKYKRTDRLSDPDPQIGCIMLTSPFFFDEDEAIPIPENWHKSIEQGKTYDTSEYYGKVLYQQVQERLSSLELSQYSTNLDARSRYGREQIIKPRLGQASFKILITEAYHRRCAITGEKTLPVLDAAHIKPYSLDGPHEVNNGLLLRKDFHTLFDRGYITIDKNYNIEVSRRIKEDFGNGREYYAHHGSKLIILPDRRDQYPDPNYLRWHNENVYLG